MAVNSLEIEDSLALEPIEMMTVYLEQDKKSIRLIQKYTLYNNEFYHNHQSWLRVPPPTPPRLFQINIETSQLFGGTEVVYERLSKMIHRLFVEVTYPTWVQEAFGLSPVQVRFFIFSLLKIFQKCRVFMCKHQDEREKFRRIEEQMLQRKNPFACLVTWALGSGIQLPRVDLSFITDSIRKRATGKCSTLIQTLQRVDSFEKRFPKQYKELWYEI